MKSLVNVPYLVSGTLGLVACPFLLFVQLITGSGNLWFLPALAGLSVVVVVDALLWWWVGTRPSRHLDLDIIDLTGVVASTLALLFCVFGFSLPLLNISAEKVASATARAVEAIHFCLGAYVILCRAYWNRLRLDTGLALGIAKGWSIEKRANERDEALASRFVRRNRLFFGACSLVVVMAALVVLSWRISGGPAHIMIVDAMSIALAWKFGTSESFANLLRRSWLPTL